MSPNFKITIWLFILYIAAFLLLWTGSRHPRMNDVPLLFIAGLLVSLLALFDIKSKGGNAVLLGADIILLLCNVLNFWAALQLIRGAAH